MKKKILRLKKNCLYFLFLFAFSFLSSFLAKALAQAETLSLTLANARNEVKLDPGENHRFAMKLYNKSASPVTGTLKIVDFIVKDEDGKPIFLENLEEPVSNRFAASYWMSLPYDRLTIAPNDKVTFDISVNVPFDARPGGHYAAVIFEALGDNRVQDQSASSISHRVAGLFYITVSGPITEKALLTKLSVPAFSEYGPVKVISVITNKGDSHISPKGFLTVSDWFGKIIDQRPLEEVNIFPEAARNYENLVGEHLMVGRYKLNLTATYGEKGQTIEGYEYFWVIPWRMIVAIALSLAILILIFRNWRRKVLTTEKDLQRKLREEEEEIERLKEELRHHS